MTLIGIAFNADPRTYPSLAPTFLTFKNAVTGADISKPAISQLSTTGVYTFLYNATVPTYFLLDGITTTTATDRYVFGIIDPVQQVDNQLSILSVSLLAAHSTLAALGTTSVALGTTSVALGNTNAALGTTSVALGTTALAGITLNFQLGTSLAAASTSLTAQAVTILSYVSIAGAGNATIIGLIGTASSAIGSTSIDPTDLFGYLKRAQEFREGNQTFSKTAGTWSISSRGNTLLATKTLTNSSTTVTKG